MFDPSEANARFPRRPNAVSTAAVVLWMLTYQRMHPDKSLEAAVKHLLATHPTLLGAVFTTAADWRAGYERAIGYAVRDRLPKRPPDRRYEREAYPRRPKADQFKKRKPRPPTDDPPT